MLYYVSSLYVLDVNHLRNILFANTFSYSVVNLSLLLVVSFAAQKLFSLMQSHLFIFAFVSIARGDIPQKILLRPMSKRVLIMSSSRCFMASGLAFKSLVHFEIIFCAWCDRVAQFVSFASVEKAAFP